jgi:signal transduction histidine kinase
MADRPADGGPKVLPGVDDAALVRRGAAGAAALLVVYATTPSSWTVLRQLVVAPAAGAFSVGCVVVAVRRYRPAARQAWMFIAAGLALFTLGIVTSGVYGVVEGSTPLPAVSDIFYLAGYPLLVCGLLVAIRLREASGLDPWAGIDAGIIAAVGALLLWINLVGPALRDGDLADAAALTVAFYVLADVLLMTIALRFLIVAPWRSRWSLRVLALGFAFTLLGDLSYMSWFVHGAPSERLWDVALLAGVVLSGVAALHPTMLALADSSGEPPSQPTVRRLWLIAAVGFVPPMSFAYRHATGTDLYLGATIVVWMVLTVLITVRFRRGVRLAQQEAAREAALSRYAAEVLAAADEGELLAVARRALDALSATGGGEAWLVPTGEPDPEPRSDAVRVDAPVDVRGEQVATVVGHATPTTAGRWRGSLRAIASQLSMALERDRLLAAEHETAASLAAQNERLRELDSMKDRFVSTVSHELRTPLTSMVGFLEILRDGEVGDLTPEQAHVVEIIDRNGHRLENLISDILVTARFDSGRMRFDMSEVDLGALVARQVESIEAVAAANHTRVRLDAAADLPPLRGDEVRLGQLVDNLLSNAVKFSPGGTVTATLARDGDRATLEISDTGVGMAPEDLDKVFDRFYRASTAGTTVGTGLGLSIARAIAEAHGGTIGVTSELGVGTTFRVELPISATDATVAAPIHDEVTL